MADHGPYSAPIGADVAIGPAGLTRAANLDRSGCCACLAAAFGLYTGEALVNFFTSVRMLRIQP